MYITWQTIQLYSLKMWYWKSLKTRSSQFILFSMTSWQTDSHKIPSRFPQRLNFTRKYPIPLQILTGHPAGNTYEKLKDNLTLSWFITYDGTNIFVLLLHFTFTGEIKSQIYMKSTNKESSTHVIDIAETYEGHIKIMPNIFPAHDLSNTVCLYFDTGNKYWMV